MLYCCVLVLLLGRARVDEEHLTAHDLAAPLVWVNCSRGEREQQRALMYAPVSTQASTALAAEFGWTRRESLGHAHALHAEPMHDLFARELGSSLGWASGTEQHVAVVIFTVRGWSAELAAAQTGRACALASAVVLVDDGSTDAELRAVLHVLAQAPARCVRALLLKRAWAAGQFDEALGRAMGVLVARHVLRASHVALLDGDEVWTRSCFRLARFAPGGQVRDEPSLVALARRLRPGERVDVPWISPRADRSHRTGGMALLIEHRAPKASLALLQALPENLLQALPRVGDVRTHLFPPCAFMANATSMHCTRTLLGTTPIRLGSLLATSGDEELCANLHLNALLMSTAMLKGAWYDASGLVQYNRSTYSYRSFVVQERPSKRLADAMVADDVGAQAVLHAAMSGELWRVRDVLAMARFAYPTSAEPVVCLAAEFRQRFTNAYGYLEFIDWMQAANATGAAELPRMTRHVRARWVA